MNKSSYSQDILHRTIEIILQKATHFKIKEYIVNMMDMSGISAQVDLLLQSNIEETRRFAIQYKEITAHPYEAMNEAN